MKPTIVLVGAGRFGKNHLRVLKELEKEGYCNLYGVADIKSDVLNEIRLSHDVATSTDFRVFLAEDVDAIDIVTPTSIHYKMCKECLEAGKHVFVEKPLTTSYVKARELVHLAEKQGKVLMVGHIFRYNLTVQKTKQLIKKGELGEVYYMFGHFIGLKDPRPDVGVLYNYAVHHIDIYNYLLEELPEKVHCCAGHYLGRKEFEDVAVLTLKYPSGTLGIIESSWLPPGKHRDLTVVGSRKSITSDLLKQTLKLHDSQIDMHEDRFKAVNRGITEIKLEFKEPLKLELLDFIESVKTGRKPLADGQAALNVIKVIEKALESAKLGRTVRIN
ncbi:MAG: Gfo/Idh/MocA family protein [Candidatus Baldrarchaeia archaeon]